MNWHWQLLIVAVAGLLSRTFCFHEYDWSRIMSCISELETVDQSTCVLCITAHVSLGHKLSEESQNWRNIKLVES